MKIVYTPQARADLKEVRDYIHNNLQNPTAAKNITNRIIKTCHILSDNPYAGFSLQSKTGRESEIRCLLCDNHIAFYEVHEFILIVRILDNRTDYMRAIFEEE